jgi:hypothetical protein
MRKVVGPMTATAIRGTRRKSRIRLGPVLERSLRLVLLALAGVWLVWNLVADPTRFTGSLLVGLQNGLLYALVALGYTMVYGVIELINFAHGDLFMLATIVAAAIMVTALGVEHLGASAILSRVLRLSTLEIRAETCSADDGGRIELRLPRHRSAGLRQRFSSEKLALGLGRPDC